MIGSEALLISHPVQQEYTLTIEFIFIFKLGQTNRFMDRVHRLGVTVTSLIGDFVGTPTDSDFM